MSLLKIHGNCRYYQWNRKTPDKKLNGCSNRGWVDYRCLKLYPLSAACEDFEEVEK